MVPEFEGRPFSHSSIQSSYPATQMWCYERVSRHQNTGNVSSCFSYDTEKEIDLEWARTVSAIDQ